MSPPEPKFVFQQTIEGLFLRGLHSQMTPILKAKLKQSGLDLDTKMDPAYPNEKFVEWIRLAAFELHPTKSEADGILEIGRAFFHGYINTLIGKAMFKMMKVIGAKRSLQRMERNFRTGNNFMSVQFEDCGPNHVKLIFAETTGIPTFYQGVILCGGEGVAKGTQVAVLENPDQSVTYEVTWES